MATTTFTITGNEWSAITLYGQSGVCWLNSNIQGGGDVVVDHSTNGGVSCSIIKGSTIHREPGVKLPFTADNLADIYYAKCVSPNSTVVLSVDTY
jgi:hypothetical protein